MIVYNYTIYMEGLYWEGITNEQKARKELDNTNVQKMVHVENCTKRVLHNLHYTVKFRK